MDRSRSKRYYYDQDYDSETLSRTKRRYNNSGYNSGNYYNDSHHRRPTSGAGGGGGGGGGRRVHEPSQLVTTSYRILCHEAKVGGVIGKSGSIIRAIREHTGARVNVRDWVTGDEERIIDITDETRRDPQGREPGFSPAQEALFLVHERILESNSGANGCDGEEDYGSRGGGNRVVTRLVVSRIHVGSLLGKGGKIMEQMKVETKTHIRILPRDHTMPRCVNMSDEIVQVVGDINAVKNAIVIISSRLRESQHRDRSHFNVRQYSPERFFASDDDAITTRRSIDGGGFGSRLSSNLNSMKSNNYGSRLSGYANESGAAAVVDHAQSFPGDDLVFRILCPIFKVDSVVGETDGLIELLQNEIGVDVMVADPVPGSDEQIVIISSEEGPDDVLFPAQEALLHIQTRIVDLVPDKENVITTRLLVPADDIGCLDGRDRSLYEMGKTTGADIQILPRNELPACVSGTYELIQIVGEIKAARQALIDVTSRLRRHIYKEFFQKDTPPPSAPSPLESALEVEANIDNSESTSVDTSASHQNLQATETRQPKDPRIPSSEVVKQVENERTEEVPSGLNRLPIPLVTRSILEVVVPECVVPKLITKSKNMLTRIGELSRANVKLIEDRPEVTEKIIQISGTPEQAERAQSLLQGFILSTQEDGP